MTTIEREKGYLAPDGAFYSEPTAEIEAFRTSDGELFPTFDQAFTHTVMVWCDDHVRASMLGGQLRIPDLDREQLVALADFIHSIGVRRPSDAR